MQSFLQGRLLTMALAGLQVFMQVMLVMPTKAWAQDLDSSPPVIESRAVEQGFKGETQVFTATVTDDRGVAAVFLHYRLDGESVYQDRRMEPLGSTGIYSTSLTTDSDVDVIQYYIEATDLAENRTLQGFAFDPIERELVERALPVADAPAAEAPAPGMSTGRKVLYGVLGLVVVGALASAAGGSGSSGGTSDQNVDVTIVVEPLP
ncbi:hypothetical protein ACUNV4_06360 [Granulosicoccus sp. 3-233]|uniref:hypothetical protein n=1 Tax=Granulosicoccus sp. 3-233 TaxID=3417969 RepID=UPI003D346E41